MDVAIVWNGKAGSAADLDAEDVKARVQRAMSRDVTIVDAGKDPRAAAREAIAAGARIVIAAGGDGTVSACATEVIGKNVELGVLPVGTSNSFSAALEISSELDEAIANLGRTDRRVIDAAVASNGQEERVMILHCMIGLHAETIEETPAEAKRRWGAIAYAVTGLKKLATVSPFAVEMQTAEHRVRCKAIAVAVANLAPVKSVLAHGPSHLLADDGRMDVTIVAADSIAEAIATGVHLYRSAQNHEAASRDNVGSFSTPRVEITTDTPQSVLVDGEPFGDTPVTIEALPRALTVIAPPPAVAEGDVIDAPLLGLPDLEVTAR
ncbi:MAG: YegS/Rv2252/BmrU family lipid kinase [Myxococcota bacterium]|nr:YegS/Rv2252/BmrU family lipid kinase [Myxococcota bacterium]